jgi:hypothetical protein
MRFLELCNCSWLMVPLRKALEMPFLSSKMVLPGMRRSHRLKT